MANQVQMLTVAEAASALVLHPETIRRMIQRGELEGVKVARQWKIPASALQRIQTQAEAARQGNG